MRRRRFLRSSLQGAATFGVAAAVTPAAGSGIRVSLGRHDEHTGEALYRMLRDLVAISAARQARYADRRELGRRYPHWWLDDYCTIRLAAGRGVGHSTAAIRLVVESAVPALYLTAIPSQARRVRRQVDEARAGKGPPVVVDYATGHAPPPSLDAARGLDLGLVVVDTAQMVGTAYMEAVEPVLAECAMMGKYPFHLVLLG